MVDRLYETGKFYRKAGLMLSGIVPDDSIKANLFVSETKNRGRFLMDMIDNINFSIRNDILKFAASGTNRNCKMRQELRSDRFTARWEEMVKVK